MDRFDVAVIGLGAMGSATAWQLARTGARVLGLDRWTPPHSMGSTHGETRLTRVAVGEGQEYVPLVRMSHQIWRELERETHQDLFRQNGLLIYGDPKASAPMHGKPDFFAQTIDVAERSGTAYEVLDAPQIAQRFPQFRVRPSDRGYYEPDAGMLFPWRCVEAQLTQAVRLGAELHFNESVADVTQIGRGPVHIETDVARYEAKAAVVSTGAWVRRFLPARIGELLTVQRQVMGWFEPNGTPDLYLPTSMPNFIRLPGHGESLVYGFARIDAATPALKVATEEATSNGDPDQTDRQVSTNELIRLHTIASLALALKPTASRAEVCFYTIAPDSRFLIDRHPEKPDVIILSPCSGHGFKHSAAIGRCAAAMALRQPFDIDVSPFRIDF